MREYNADLSCRMLTAMGFYGVRKVKISPTQFSVIVPYYPRNYTFTSLASVHKYIAQIKKEELTFINR